MSDYYQHKPTWGGNSTGRTAQPKVLDAIRQPSGEWQVTREIKPPGRNAPVPRTKGNPHGYTPKGLLRKARFATGMAGGFMDMAQELFGPSGSDAVDYGMDDFMEGRLPPPWDWLNYTSPEARRLMDPGFVGPGEFGKQTHRPQNFDNFIWRDHSDGYRYGVPLPPGLTRSGSWVWATYASLANQYDKPLGWNQSRVTPGGYADPTWQTSLRDPYHWKFWLLDTFGGRLNWTGIVGNLPSGASSFDPRTWSPPAGAHVPWQRTNAGTPEQFFEYAKTWPAFAVSAPQYMPGAGFVGPMPNWALGPKKYLDQMSGTHGRDGGDPPSFVGTEGKPPRPPGPGEKEKKRKASPGFVRFASNVFHGLTEYQDALDSLHDALPKKFQAKSDHILAKSLAVWSNFEHVDVGDAIVNLAWNQFEDYVLGRGLFGLNQKAANARGDRYGFRTLNSMNNVGGLEQLGEFYGEFSKDHVNPNKDALKKYLTERFGI